MTIILRIFGALARALTTFLFAPKHGSLDILLLFFRCHLHRVSKVLSLLLFKFKFALVLLCNVRKRPLYLLKIMTEMGYKVVPRLRESPSWLPLAAGHESECRWGNFAVTCHLSIGFLCYVLHSPQVSFNYSRATEYIRLDLSLCP